METPKILFSVVILFFKEHPNIYKTRFTWSKILWIVFRE